MTQTSILIVDDEPAICSSLKRLLKNHVEDIHMVNSAHDAISIVQQYSFDIVISDVHMPNMSGVEFFSQLSEISPDTLQILITGINEYSILTAAINSCNLYGYIPKPWDNEIVINLIQNALSLKQLKDEQTRLYRKIEEQNSQLKKLNIELSSEIKAKEYYAQRLDDEINAARETQEKLIPGNYTTRHCFSGFNYPARYLSGDFYDYIKLDENEFLFCLGDVSGKGINASLMMVKVSSLIHGFSQSNINIAELANLINVEICNAMLNGMFITMVIGIINHNKNTIELVNAGHLPVLCVNAKSEVEYFADNIPIGILKDEEYIVQKIDCANSKIFIYSDGLVDRTDEDGNPFGFDMIKQMLIDTCKNDPDNILQSITEKLSLTNAELEDDATILMIDTNDH